MSPRRKAKDSGKWRTLYKDDRYHAQVITDSRCQPPRQDQDCGTIEVFVVSGHQRPLLLTMPHEDADDFTTFLSIALAQEERQA